MYTIALAVVCLIKINNLPEIGVSFADKIFHLLAYSVLAFLWFSSLFYTLNLEKNKALLYAALFSVIFGIIIEILQGVLTKFRSADFYDVMANTLGVFLTAMIIFITVKKINTCLFDK